MLWSAAASQLRQSNALAHVPCHNQWVNSCTRLAWPSNLVQSARPAISHCMMLTASQPPSDSADSATNRKKKSLLLACRTAPLLLLRQTCAT